MSEERMGRGSGVWEWLAALACFVIGILSLAVGFVLTTDRLLDAHLHPSLHALGIVLLIVGIPVIILGGHCMDLGEERNKHVVLALSFLSVLFLSASKTVQAQQTIFNVPSTDVLGRGKVYAELDASVKPVDGSDVAKFSSFVPRLVIGAGNNVEFGLNLTGNIQPGLDSTTLVPAIKWKPFQRESGWAVVVGDHLFIPVRNRGYNAGNYVYAEFSKTFKQGTRITFGGFDFTRDVVAPANRAGGQFGFEQPLNNKFTFAADWFTGKHSAGYFTPGIIFKAGPRVTGYAGYSIGNQNASGGNHFLLLELGYNFN
ncbi:MAG TPA: hypothetical protein VGD61_03480 [Pyrinomonadaceae bacterium]